MADLQARNIHMRVEDESILKDFEDEETKHPSPRQVDGDRIIYESRGLRMPSKSGRPILCDFGEARYGNESYQDDIQPYVYRAPEIMLDIPWTCKVDIWNLGVMVRVLLRPIRPSHHHADWLILGLGSFRKCPSVHCSRS